MFQAKGLDINKNIFVLRFFCCVVFGVMILKY
jgi:hypothetical protein